MGLTLCFHNLFWVDVLMIGSCGWQRKKFQLILNTNCCLNHTKETIQFSNCPTLYLCIRLSQVIIAPPSQTMHHSQYLCTTCISPYAEMGYWLLNWLSDFSGNLHILVSCLNKEAAIASVVYWGSWSCSLNESSKGEWKWTTAPVA